MLPKQNITRKTTTQISVFRGINCTENTGFSRVDSRSDSIFCEFEKMKNLCDDAYPKLHTRKPRSRVFEDVSEQAPIISNLIFADGKLMYVNGNGKLNYDGTLYPASDTITGFDSTKEHRLTQYGNNVIIMPEKLYFNLSSKTFESIENRKTLGNFSGANKLYQGTEIFKSCSIEKISLDDYDKPRTAAYKILSGIDLTDLTHQLPIDNQGNYKHQGVFQNIQEGETVETLLSSPSALYKCYAIGAKNNYNNPTNTGALNVRRGKAAYFVRENNYYVRIRTSTRTETAKLMGFKKGDYIKITGMEHILSIPGLSQASVGILEDLAYEGYIDVLNNNTFKIYDVSSNESPRHATPNEGWIVIKANIECSIPYGGPMTIERVMPPVDEDKLIEVNNRLWACSSESNEIYASKQGDCENWQAYGDGISTDSFAATIGCEGSFTGIARQNDSVIFFKENWILKVYGNKPSNYAISKFNVLGVEKGSGKSLTWINGVLFYLSPLGVCRYSPGGQPVVISKSAFGNKKYRNGVGGRHRNKYYISAQNEDGEYELFVYDTETGMWHKEDNTQFLSAETYNNILYYIDGNTNMLMCADKEHNLIEEMTGYEQENEFDWYAQTGNLYNSEFAAKYISKLYILCKLDVNGYMNILAKFRDRGEWMPLKVIRNEIERPRQIQIAVRRADFLKIRLEGRGQCQISGILIEYSKGAV